MLQSFEESHSSRPISACRKSLERRSALISDRCGLGIINRRIPRRINSCLPPENGYSKSKRRKRLMKSRRGIGRTFTIQEAMDSGGLSSMPPIGGTGRPFAMLNNNQSSKADAKLRRHSSRVFPVDHTPGVSAISP
jgi:hypothetical protein